MEKGKFGFRLSFYAVTAFILAALGNSTALALLAGVALFVEKDEWAGRQVIQAFLLCLFASIVSVCLNVFDFMAWFSWAEYGSALYKVNTVWNRIESVINYLVRILVYVFALIGILKTAKGQEAGVPLAGNFANWAYGKVRKASAFQQPVQAAPADVCANCGAPLNGSAFCTKCGTPAAK